jgi:signal transduction histidine kinase
VLRSATFRAWLPVLVLPPILLGDAAIVGEKPVTWAGVVVAVVACLPLVLRSRLSFVWMGPLITGGIILLLTQIEPENTLVLIPAVALVELGMRSSRRHNLWVAAALVLCVFAGIVPFTNDPADFADAMSRNLLLCWLALAVGDIYRERSASIEQETRQRLDEERLEIARDVHDVVAHAMVAINVQAGVAAHLIDRDPGQARDALRAIKDTSGEALTDLRATLGVLRGDESAPTRPAQNLGDLEELAAGLRAAGVDVSFEVGEVGDAPAAVQAAGYRIVQEALTNALRHANASRVRVTVARDGDAIELQVDDDGAGRVNGAGGNGLRGMRERAEALSGSFESGPGHDGGWRVHARLPE